MGSEGISFVLEGEEWVNGTISFQYDSACFFTFDEFVVNKNISLNLHGDREFLDFDDDYSYYDIDPKNLRLGEDILIYLQNGGEIHIKALVKKIVYEETAMDSARSVVITEFKISDEDLSKLNDMSLSVSMQNDNG